ncbi:hypothetical protein ACWN8V_12025 [Vagococcus elongatus]|uniref:Uncharacterized protein n=1 Tax=Vagococcus elongatus TaxID=180344 RepID=A0A430B3Y7_9ENTE|nr:hypothetical protein [Vagococcus elongatus]RSU15057.1 hypothetical protein CBF29_01590 [Vagococcus elongatus]
MNYHTKKLLSLTDKNLYFSKDCFVEEKFREITTSSIRRRLNYTLVRFTKYLVENEGQFIKYGTRTVRIKLLPVCSYKIILELKKTTFYVKNVGRLLMSKPS